MKHPGNTLAALAVIAMVAFGAWLSFDAWVERRAVEAARDMTIDELIETGVLGWCRHDGPIGERESLCLAEDAQK